MNEEKDKSGQKQEDLIFKTKVKYNANWIAQVFFCIIGLGLVLLSFGNHLLLEIYNSTITRLFVFMLGIFVFILSITTLNKELQISNATYSFYEDKLVQELGNGLYSRNHECNEVNYSEIAYFILERQNHLIEIYKKIEGHPYEWKKFENKNSYYREHDLQIIQAQREKYERIISILVEKIPARLHPNLGFLYVNHEDLS